MCGTAIHQRKLVRFDVVWIGIIPAIEKEKKSGFSVFYMCTGGGGYYTYFIYIFVPSGYILCVLTSVAMIHSSFWSDMT